MAVEGLFESARPSACCAKAAPPGARVTIADPPCRLGWLEIADDRVAIAVEFRLSSDETGGTVLTHTKTAIEPEALAPSSLG